MTAIGSVLAFAALAACQAGAPSENLSINTKQAPSAAVVAIAKVAQDCWFKSGDRAFAPYRLANETSSHTGQPRFLLVPRKDPGGLPSLVVQARQRGDAATGSYTRIETFGPLLRTSNGKRIADDVRRWSKGNKKCKA